MALENSLITYLLAQSSLATAVNNNIRLNNVAPDTPYPFLVVSLSDDEPFNTLNGSASMSNAHFEVEIYASKYADVSSIYISLRSALHLLSGNMSGTSVAWCYATGARDLTLPPPDGSRNWIYHRSCDYSVAYYL